MDNEMATWQYLFRENEAFWELRVEYGGANNELNAAFYRIDDEGEDVIALATQVAFMADPRHSTRFNHYQYTPYPEGVAWGISEIIGKKLVGEVRDVNREYNSRHCPFRLSNRLWALLEEYRIATEQSRSRESLVLLDGTEAAAEFASGKHLLWDGLDYFELPDSGNPDEDTYRILAPESDEAQDLIESERIGIVSRIAELRDALERLGGAA